jgi:peptidoglycan/LPS O-acetylase OafA/YrhL
MATDLGRFAAPCSTYVMAETMPRFSMTVPQVGSLMRRTPREKPAKDPSEIASLTGIRAVAVMIVFMGHSGVPYSMAPLGVTIFFFLSGYLITTLLRREFDRNGTISLRAFYLRRACRILPPLYIVLILANLLTLAGALQYHQLRLGACLSQFFFFSNYHILQTGWEGVQTGTAPGTSALWSLAVEEHFYLLFPLFYLMLRRRVPSPHKQALVLAGICGAVLLWRFVLISALHTSFDRTYVGTDTRIDSILFGCILGVLGNPAIDGGSYDGSSRVRRLWAPILAPLGLVAFLLAYPWPQNLGPALFRHVEISATLQYTIQGLALIPIFVVAVRFAKWGIFRLLNHPAVVLVGFMSYSMYISEEVINALVHKNIPGGALVHGAMYLVLTLGFAWSMYRVVEKPFALVRRRLSRVVVAKPRSASVAQTPPLESGRTRPGIHLPAASRTDVVPALESGVQLD